MSSKAFDNYNNTVSSLEERISYCAQKYYEGNPIISDEEFDILVDKLRDLSPYSDILREVGWGYDISKVSGKKADHKYQLIGSLEKAKTPEQVRSSIRNSVSVISAKLDGLSVVIYYKKGLVVRAITRGNGTTGVDVTDKIRYMVSDTISSDFTGAIRGEVLISNDNWKSITTIHPEAKNQRNYASGIMNRNDISEDIKYLEFVPYNIMGYEGSHKMNNLEMLDVLDWLSEKFFSKVPHTQYISLESLADFQKEMEHYYRLLGNKYPVDGIVITNAHLVFNEDSKAIIYDQQSYKFKSDTKETVVQKVNWRLTRTQKLVPVLEIEPVELCGATIRHVTAFNAKYIYDNMIGPGTIVEIERSNEVIPDIQRTVSTNYNAYTILKVMPNKCPCCGEDLSWISNGNSYPGTDIVCTNKLCNNISSNDLMSWVSIIGKTEGISSTLIRKFLDELTVFSISDIYENTRVRFPESSGKQKLLFNKVLDKLYDEKIDVVTALCALNIPRLGKASAEKLASNMTLLELLIDYTNKNINTNVEESYIKDSLSKILGNATSQSIIDNMFNKFINLNYIRDRLEYSIVPDSSDFTKVAVTGKLSVKRSDFEKELNSNGYVISAVNKDCRFLITDNPNGSSSKNKKASELGIEKITEADFRRRFLNG